MRIGFLIACTLLLGACAHAGQTDGAAVASVSEPTASPHESVSGHPNTQPPQVPSQEPPSSQLPEEVDGETAPYPPRYVVQPKNHLIKRVDQEEENILLLTFDDGPVAEVTPALLDVLDRHQVKAIWFVNGHQLAVKHPDGTFTLKPDKADLLREIHQRGHLIGNHTWWHENLRQLSPDKQREEIVSTSEVIRQIIGEPPRYFRPPFGAATSTSDAVCRELGMQSMNWSIGSLDWDSRVYKTPGGIVKQVLDTAHSGGTVLFHDRPWTAEQLDEILTRLKQQGYRFVLPTETMPPSAK